MPIRLGAVPAPPDPDLLADLRRASFPTIGHYLDEGFCDSALRRLVGAGTVVGRARTVRTVATDSTVLHAACSRMEAGDVLVVDTGGDRRHAPLGEVVATALALRGAAAVLVDGVVTDIDQLIAIGLPVYAYGTSLLTTKLEDSGLGGIDLPVSLAGVPVRPGDVVLADANGVLVAPPPVLAAVVKTVLQDDEEEPDLLDALRAGGSLGTLTGAEENLRRHAVATGA